MSKPLIPLVDLYHTGVIVDDVEAAKAEYSDLMGVTWGPEGEADVPVWFPTGPRLVTFKYAYTAEGPHHIELVRPVPESLWTVTGVGHAHHFGYWCDDVPGVSAELAKRGLPLCAKVGVDSAEADAPIVLHQAKSGVYIELVTSASRAVMFGGRA